MTFEEDLSSRYWAYRYVLDTNDRDTYLSRMVSYLDFLELGRGQRNSLHKMYAGHYNDFRRTVMRMKAGEANVVARMVFYWLKYQNLTREILSFDQLLIYRRATARPLNFDLPGLFPFFYWKDETLVRYTEEFKNDLSENNGPPGFR